MKYEAFLEKRGMQFRRIAAKVGEGVVCTTSFGAIDLTSHVWSLAQSRLDQNLVKDLGGYGVMHDYCDIEPLVEFFWKVERWRELRVVVQYVKNSQGRTFICVQRGSHGWYALARINRPDDQLLLREFFSTRRAHDKEGFGFCASKGAPNRIYNYRPDLFDRQTVVEMYGYWLRWAERLIGGKSLHYGVWEGEVKHGVGKKKADIDRLTKSVEYRILNRSLTKLVMLENGEIQKAPPRVETPVKNDAPRGVSLHESMQWHRDGYERLASIRLEGFKKEGKLEAGRDLLEKIIVVVGDKPELVADYYMKLGIINEGLNDYQKASEAYRRALALEPKEKAPWYFAHNNLGFCLNELHQYREAQRYLRDAIAIEPTWHNAYKNLGVALAAQGEYAEAAKLFVQATVLSQYDPRALEHLEELLDEHEVVYLQVPEIRANLEKCRKLVKRKDCESDPVRRIPPPATAEMADSSLEESHRKPKTIALLDDETVFLDVIGDVIAQEGFEVLTCTNKRTFLKELPELSVDLVITDLFSPGMNGFQFLAELKRDEKLRNIPVIIVSGNADAEGVKAKLQGAYRIFRKPFEIEKLLAAVRSAL